MKLTAKQEINLYNIAYMILYNIGVQNVIRNSDEQILNVIFDIFLQDIVMKYIKDKLGTGSKVIYDVVEIGLNIYNDKSNKNIDNI